MRILVYGAGVIGVNLAADLYSYGKDVTLLARGEWADTLERKGLVILPFGSFRKRKYNIPVIRKLKKDDVYDVILVTMRYTQLDSVLFILAENISKNIVLIGNNLFAEEYIKALKNKNVLFGFYMAAGHREKEYVVSISLRKLTVGSLKEGWAEKELIGRIFTGTRVKVTYQSNMEDYLLCHAALVVPIAFACYCCNGNLKKISKDRACLNMVISANIEGYKAIESAGHIILPKICRDFRSGKYRIICYFIYRVMSSTAIGKICASDHALNAVEEISALNNRLKRFYDAHKAEYPNYHKLEKSAEKYMSKDCVSRRGKWRKKFIKTTSGIFSEQESGGNFM